MWYVYIVKCKDNRLYTGITSNLKRRFREHKEGRDGGYTLLHKPARVAYFESFKTKQEALGREKQLKGWSHKKKENLIKFGKPHQPGSRLVSRAVSKSYQRGPAPHQIEPV